MLLRPQALALLLSVAAPFAGTVAVAIAEPLDKESCANFQVERKKLLTTEMQAALEHGPDWVKDHLDDECDRKSAAFSERGRADRSSAAGAAAWPKSCISH